MAKGGDEVKSCRVTMARQESVVLRTEYVAPQSAGPVAWRPPCKYPDNQADDEVFRAEKRVSKIELEGRVKDQYGGSPSQPERLYSVNDRESVRRRKQVKESSNK